jgi:hypothetical protein
VDVHDSALRGISGDRDEGAIGCDSLDEIDRLILQRDRSRERSQAPVIRIEQRELVRQQAPACSHQPGTQRALTDAGMTGQ